MTWLQWKIKWDWPMSLAKWIARRNGMVLSGEMKLLITQVDKKNQLTVIFNDNVESLWHAQRAAGGPVFGILTNNGRITFQVFKPGAAK